WSSFWTPVRASPAKPGASNLCSGCTRRGSVSSMSSPRSFTPWRCRRMMWMRKWAGCRPWWPIWRISWLRSADSAMSCRDPQPLPAPEDPRVEALNLALPWAAALRRSPHL
ncbi:unnamed protein product, partial [Cladocopium goreaui]